MDKCINERHINQTAKLIIDSQCADTDWLRLKQRLGEFFVPERLWSDIFKILEGKGVISPLNDRGTRDVLQGGK